jgi:hypothetical protein
MATIVTVESNVVITETGVSVVDRTFSVEYEVTDKQEGSVWLDGTIDVATFCVRGTDLGVGGVGGQAITDPFVLPLAFIRGFALEADIPVELNIGVEVAPITLAIGPFVVGRCEAALFQVTRLSGAGNVKFVVWGDR